MSNLAGKVAVVTGGNSGVGKETAVGLAQLGAHVVIAARNATKANAAVDEIRTRTGAGDRVETMPIDLASFDSVRKFAAAYRNSHDRLDILVNNAGLVLGKRRVTDDGHETQFQVNHLGHFLLANELRDMLVASAPARVVVVSSIAHQQARDGLDFDDLDWSERRYRGFKVYCATKLANILFSNEFARRLAGTGVTCNSLHPGFVASNFARENDLGWWANIGMPLARPFAISAKKGALTSIHVASSDAVEELSGLYFKKCVVAMPSANALDDAAAARLWEVSEKMVAG
jgi:NAD(P)-dependent dehydrogenase (short-subunit alcohol dehydrogenase family)